jgi:hypothetical protein
MTGHAPLASARETCVSCLRIPDLAGEPAVRREIAAPVQSSKGFDRFCGYLLAYPQRGAFQETRMGLMIRGRLAAT